MDEAEAETIICQSCANEVPADADFCHVCGIKWQKAALIVDQWRPFCCAADRMLSLDVYSFS